MWAGRIAITLQVEGLSRSSRRWPFRLRSPGVLSHDEEAYRWFIRNPVLDPLKPVVEPTKLDPEIVHLGGRPEISLADLGGQVTAVSPWPDDEVVSLSKLWGSR